MKLIKIVLYVAYASVYILPAIPANQNDYSNNLIDLEQSLVLLNNKITKKRPLPSTPTKPAAPNPQEELEKKLKKIRESVNPTEQEEVLSKADQEKKIKKEIAQLVEDLTDLKKDIIKFKTSIENLQKKNATVPATLSSYAYMVLAKFEEKKLDYKNLTKQDFNDNNIAQDARKLLETAFKKSGQTEQKSLEDIFKGSVGKFKKPEAPTPHENDDEWK